MVNWGRVLGRAILAEEATMTTWIALYIGYAAIILAAIEELRIDKPLKKVLVRLSDFESKRGLCCLRG